MWPGAGRRPPREKQASAASHVDASAADLLYTEAIPDGVKCQPSDQRRMTANAGDLRGLARAALDRPGDPGRPVDSRARAFTSWIARRQDARLSGEFRLNDLGNGSKPTMLCLRPRSVLQFMRKPEDLFGSSIPTLVKRSCRNQSVGPKILFSTVIGRQAAKDPM
jgi:hypothetical protein